MKEEVIKQIQQSETALGIELGSTRIKSVLINKNHEVIAKGAFNWENRLEDGLWTYHLDDALRGVRESFGSLAANVRERYGIELESVGRIGISGMMHGYIPLDKDDRQLSRFLTWRNTNTVEAVGTLTELFRFNIPLRWSISQLYQAILNKEEHVGRLAYFCTLAAYIHYLLTGEKVIGVGEASGMFPIDSTTNNFDQNMLDRFDKLIEDRGYPWKIRDILPKVLVAGEDAGCLTEKGARLLDPTGKLRAGIRMVPPEGDAGTGMTATNAVGPRTGNVSCGTSIFAMVVLEKQLSRLYKDIDMVTTPSGMPVAMVHCNNGTSVLDAWVGLFRRFVGATGLDISDGQMFEALYKESLKGAADCDGVMAVNYLSGEPVTGITEEGRPMVVYRAESDFSLANFMRSQIYSIFGALTIGMRILENENVVVDRLTGHGGMFTTKGVAQRFLSAAVKAPITCLESAGEGGPYGMALLAMYAMNREPGEKLEDYLDDRVFAHLESTTLEATREEKKGYMDYLAKYEKILETERSAVDMLR